MPCRIPSHNHDWPRSGTLSISKCEFKCDFCSSTKDYKPASALRKHVLTHIKNDKMPLTLDKSTGGRPRLQITAIDPPSLDQPKTYPPNPELTLTSEPVLGALHAQGETIDTIDDISLCIKNMFPREHDHATYSSRFNHVPDALMIVEAAVGLAKTLGPKRTLIRRGLDNMMICMTECRTFDEGTGGPSDYWKDSHDTLHEEYRAFQQALYDTTRNLRYSHFNTISVMVLEIIHAMWILSVIVRLDYAHEDRSTVSRELELDFAPMMQYFETTEMTFDELCDDVYRANCFDCVTQNLDYWGQSQVRKTYLALKLYHHPNFGSTSAEYSGPTVAKIIRLLNEIVDSAWKLNREEASKRCLLD